MKSLHIIITALALLSLCAHAEEAAEAEAEAEAATDVAPLPVLTVLGREIGPIWTYGQSDSIALDLASNPRVLVNSQGGGGSQNDLSIRGSSFSGAGLSLGGVSLRHPQTEHFHAELPLPSSLLTVPHVLTGLDQIAGVDGHLVGSVAYDLPPVYSGRQISAGLGEGGRDWQQVLARERIVPDEGELVYGVSAFAGRESAEGVDYEDNDLDRWYGGGHLQFINDELQGDLVVGRQEKEFGTRGYYGVDDVLPADEEIEDTLLLATGRWGRPDEDYLRLTGYYREFNDQYRILPDIFFNETDTEIFSVFADGRQALTGDLDLTLRIGGENEDVDGLSLGDHSRRRGSLLLLPSWKAGRVRVSAGAKGEVFSGDGPAILPQAGIDVVLCENSSAFASYTETVRQPSYTELNFESPASLGNQGLDRQETQNVEVGLRGETTGALRWSLAGFFRRSRDTVDWTQGAPGERWTATDLGEVDALGAELLVGGSLSEMVDVDAAYQFLDKDSDTDPYASRYVLDYPEHLARVSAALSVSEALRVVALQTLRWQADNAVRRSDDFGAIGSLAVHLGVPRVQGMVVSVLVENTWDDDFEPFPGQKPADQRASASVTMDW